MAVIEVNRNPSRRELKQFGVIWLVFFLLAAAWLRFKLGSPLAAAAVAVAAAAVPAAGWAVPAVMRTVYVGLSYLAWPIGFVVSHLLLGAVYYLLVTPIGLVMRAVGYDPMRRRFEAKAGSYWIERGAGGRDPRSYFRQF